jgi:ectoine hydroxylase-related dioxygenase (phytanoyl-CoA dioxygenase family)
MAGPEVFPMNEYETARKFSDDGYAIARGVYSVEELAEIEQQLEQFIQTNRSRMAESDLYYEDAAEKPIKAIHNIEKYSSWFAEFAEDPRLMRIMQAVWPSVGIVPHGLMFFAKAPRSGSLVPPHQDSAFQNLEPPEDLVCTIAIDESTSSNGALTVQRGSHKAGRLPHRPSGVKGFSQTLVEPLDAHDYPAVQLHMRPGDISLHHTNTVHFSGPNTTPHGRRQLGIGYRTLRAKLDGAAWAKYQADLAKLHTSETTAS